MNVETKESGSNKRFTSIHERWRIPRRPTLDHSTLLVVAPLRSLPLGVQPDGLLDGPMQGGEVSSDEEGVVVGVEDGLLGILPGEGLDLFDRVPEREHQELAAIADIAPEH